MAKTSRPASKARNSVKAKPDAASSRSCDRTPIVAIGASAGGLEALELFLGGVPKKSGLAFVVILHLDPTQKGIMPELLQRFTRMPVRQAKDRTRVRPDRVYVIPPNKDMSVLRGVLHLLAPADPRGLRLPIDHFFRSLADDGQELGIGVILSGMGSDGVVGLRAIKEQGGLGLAQEPSTARYDSMPRSVVDAGLADIVAPAEALPERIAAFLLRGPAAAPAPSPEGKFPGSLDKVMLMLRARTRHDFSAYKKSTMHRRIERRMGIHQIDRMSTYVRYLQKNPQEVDLLFRELLIGVTNFFRDPSAWECLESAAIPALLAARPSGGKLRAWVAGCSTGEEAYSLAIAFREALERSAAEVPFTLSIFATDLDPDAIDRARQGLYPAGIAADLGLDRLRRHFVQEGDSFRVAKDIREMVVFAPQNLLSDPPFTKMDLVCCRNLLIYLNAETQKKILPVFHYSLNQGGFLFLGSAETTGSAGDLFTAVDLKARIFRRVDIAPRLEPGPYPPYFVGHVPRPEAAAPAAMPTGASLQSLADQVLLQNHCPAALLVNDKGDILYINGRTGAYLEPAAGKANWNLLAMARDGLRSELTSTFQSVVRKRGTRVLRNLKVRTDGGEQGVDIMLQSVEEPEALRQMVLVVFRKVEPPVPAETRRCSRKDSVHLARAMELEKELMQTRETLQMTMEEMQSSQEELKSSNEEMQSTNEELQSTNEELTTSREEMQSLNEELQTVNAELQHKVSELTLTSNDMQNLLNSTEIATVFLDDEFRVRRFTPQASRIIRLIPSDAGRPLVDLVSDLDYPGLLDDAAEVLRTLSPRDRQAPASGGRWYAVRIMPYRTWDKKIDGVVLTFSDITAAKTLEVSLRSALAALGEVDPERARALGQGIAPPFPGTGGSGQVG